MNEQLKNSREAIEKLIDLDLREAAHWYGGWDELRKHIDLLEAADNEAASERYYSGGADAWSGGFADNH